MSLKDNIEYWKLSLDNPEKVIDEYYVNDKIIISNQELIKEIHRLREIISVYCYLLKYEDEIFKQFRDKLLSDLFNLIESIESIQYSEFIAFWKVFDISYSVYKNITDKDEKRRILKTLVENFCKKRHELYTKIGYSDVTVQALSDSGASRGKGIKGIVKLVKIIEEISKNNNINIPKISSILEFDKKNWYFLVDENDKKFFDSFKSKFKINYDFGRTHHDKLPDIVVKVGKEIMIIEAKHIKEGGGAQSKQIIELIEFIKQEEKSQNIHYVSFLDGIYFNMFINPPPESQIHKQRKDIENTLRKFKQNYFVNTAGFKRLFEDLIKNNQ